MLVVYDVLIVYFFVGFLLALAQFSLSVVSHYLREEQAQEDILSFELIMFAYVVLLWPIAVHHFLKPKD